MRDGPIGRHNGVALGGYSAAGDRKALSEDYLVSTFMEDKVMPGPAVDRGEPWRQAEGVLA